MLKILGIIGLVLIVAIAGILIYALTKPNDFQIQRSTTIKAPPDKIFGLIDDFHQWRAWSPYEKMDPAMTRTYGGAEKGRGAVYEWSGSGKVGQGRMEITDAPKPDKVLIKLDFLKPFEGHNVAEFKLVPDGDTTQVTWTMRGPMPFVAKVMSTFFNMDQMIGKDFEDGLANLKTLAEG